MKWDFPGNPVRVFGSGRRRWTRKQRQGLLARFHKGQLTQSDFTAQHGVGLSTLSRWLRLEREPVPFKINFQEVRLPNPISRWPVEVVSPQGWMVRLHNVLTPLANEDWFNLK